MSQFNRVKQNSFLSNDTRRTNRREHTNSPYRVSSLSNRRATIQNKQFVVKDDDFPSLNNNNNDNNNNDNNDNNNDNNDNNKSTIAQNNWQNTIKEHAIEEEEKKKSCINEHDSKYWRGAKWIGPMLMRQKQPISHHLSIQSDNNSSSLISTDTNINQNKESVLISQYNRIEYSRDNVTWHATWNDTFSEEQLYDMKQEEEYEYQERCATILFEYRDRLRKESELYYNEIGELDGFALREIEREEYEEYAKQFEIDSGDENSDNENNENNENNPDYLEDDY